MDRRVRGCNLRATFLRKRRQAVQRSGHPRVKGLAGAQRRPAHPFQIKQGQADLDLPRYLEERVQANFALPSEQRCRMRASGRA